MSVNISVAAWRRKENQRAVTAHLASGGKAYGKEKSYDEDGREGGTSEKAKTQSC